MNLGHRRLSSPGRVPGTLGGAGGTDGPALTLRTPGRHPAPPAALGPHCHVPARWFQGSGCPCLWGTITSPATCLWDLGSQARGRARAPVVGAPSPNCWTNREPQTPGNINCSEAAQRSSSQHQDPALSNCLQTPLLEVSGQTTSKTGIQHHPLKKRKK